MIRANSFADAFSQSVGRYDSYGNSIANIGQCNDAPNTSVNRWGCLQWANAGGTYGTQIAHTFHTTDIYSRNIQNGTWSTWKRICSGLNNILYGVDMTLSNWNNCKTPGWYSASGASNGHSDFGSTWVQAIEFNQNGNTDFWYVIAFCGAHIYQRTGSTKSGWNSWVKIV